MGIFLKNGGLTAPRPDTPILVNENPVITSEGFSGIAGNIAVGRYTDIVAGGIPMQWIGSSGFLATDGSGHAIRGGAGTGSTSTQVLAVGDFDVQVEYDIPTLPTAGTLRLLARFPGSSSSAPSAYCQVTLVSAGTVALLSQPNSSTGATTHATSTAAAGDRIGIRVVGSTISMLKNGAVVGTASPALDFSGHTGVGIQGSTTAGFVMDNLLVRQITNVAAL